MRQQAERVALSRHPFAFFEARLTAGRSDEPAVLVVLYSISASVPVVVEPDLGDPAHTIEKRRSLRNAVPVLVEEPDVANSAGQPPIRGRTLATSEQN
jgi:hypothetical protein